MATPNKVHIVGIGDDGVAGLTTTARELLIAADLLIGAPTCLDAVSTEAERFVVGGNITEPVKLSGPNPIYPEAARRARIQGVVVLECTIGKQGSVQEVKVLRPLPLGLTEAAIDAVNKWKFKPSTLNGKPVEVLYILTVRFNLQ